MKFRTEKCVIVSECLGSLLDEIAFRLTEDVGYRAIVDDGVVIDEMENLVLIDTDKGSPELKDTIEELKEEFLRNDPEINSGTTVMFKIH